MKFGLLSPALLGLLAIGSAEMAQAQIRRNPGFRQNVLERNDDGSSPLVPLGWTLNFFGRLRSHAYVNNNGNITFDSPLQDYTPFGLTGVAREIIAPFFADVDTRNETSQLVTYGQDMVDGKRAFAANFVDVGYYNSHADKLNRFQLVLIERADTGSGNFDIEFNYERIAWETGDASGGSNGFGDVSASAGWSNGSGEPGTSYEVPGSLVAGSFLDNGPLSLVAGRAAGTAGRAPLGRWIFRARDGVLLPPLTITGSCPLPNATAGRAYNFKLTAEGGRAPYRWAMTPDPNGSTGGFTVTQGGIVTGSPTAPGIYAFTLQVTSTDEDGDQTVSARCSITVDPATISIRSNSNLPAAIAGTRYQTRLQAEGGSGPVVFRTHESSDIPGLTLSPDGVLSGVPTAPGSYQLQVMASGEAAEQAVPAVKRFILQVAPSALSVASTCPLPTAYGDVAYSYTFSPAGGVGPFRWSAIGSLPRGLFLSAEGKLSGIPTVPAWWPFEVRVEDSRGATATIGCGLAVEPPALRVRNGCVLPAATLGLGYSQALEADGGLGPYSWAISSGALPQGLTLSQTGRLSGTPFSTGVSQFRVVITDGQGQSGSTNCSLTVNRGEYSIATCPLPEAQSGEPYQTRLVAAGGTEPYVWSARGPLPSGLHLGGDGSLSGVAPAPGTYAISSQVTDGAGQVTYRTCDLKVLPRQLRLAGACELPTAFAGTSYSARLTAAGGVEPYTFSARGLPAGLAVSADGLVYGTPERVGSGSATYEVKDGAGAVATASCVVGVHAPAPPEVRLSGMPSTLVPASAGPEIHIMLDRAYPLALEAEAVLEIAVETDSGNPSSDQADPSVKFRNGQLRLPVRFEPGARHATAPIQSTGTVASTQRVSLTRLRAPAANLEFPVQAAAVSGRLPRQVPTLTNACYTRSEDGFVLEITGYSTTRELQTGKLTFGSNEYTVNLAAPAQEYFGGGASVPSGGTFRIRAPFRVTPAGPQTLGEGSAVVSNRVGASASRAIRACQ